MTWLKKKKKKKPNNGSKDLVKFSVLKNKEIYVDISQT